MKRLYRIGPVLALAFAVNVWLPASPPPTVHAVLVPANQRKPAPNFLLKDRSGIAMSVADYRGKVVLLDFWATWCTGCKEEIPYFSAVAKTYRSKGFAIIGVSMDEGGWRAVKPFLAHTKVSYGIVIGDGATAQKYDIKSLADTFLIDRQGRIAAVYTSGLVDKADVEAKIKAVL